MHTAGISAQVCSTSTKNWFHIGINYDQAGGFTHYCFGGKGTWYFISNTIDWTCAGNNHGTFDWFPASGGQSGYNFLTRWSRDWPALTDADYVTINGWSGSISC